MFSYSFRDESDELGVEDAKVQKITPTFNNNNMLQFILQPDKRFFKPANTTVNYIVEIPGNYSLDNDCYGKLFENLEVNLNHEGRYFFLNKHVLLNVILLDFL